MKNLSIDIETYSSADLSKSGVYRYCESPDFEILLFSYSADGGEVVVVDIASGESIPKEIVAALSDATVTKWAFNAQFERICLSRYIGSYLNPQGWRCTMVWAATLGLPLSLEGVGAVLKLEKQKLQEGKALIKYFCMPCAPTKTNGGRQRNLPEHDLQKWQQFKDYNTRDVETEMEIQAKLAKFPVLEAEWENYRLDQIINDRGVALDMEFVNQAITCDEISRDSLYKRLQSITGLDNPNSVQQMRGWLADNGMETDSLDKAAVSELLENAPPKLKEVLLLRQEISKSSVRKYAAMENVVGSDGRARGLIQFYGANRTGRFAGRLIQVQNLPRNYMANLKDARDLVKSGRFDELEMLFDSTSTVLSELIRTAFVPKKNTRFIVADFSSIERVVLAWLAGEKWVLDAYIEKRDLYSATASQMFGVPLEKIDKKGPLRQKGKVADLACIAEGQLVLTDKGLIPIENVTLNHKVWDGISWVSHEGVIYKGEGEVMEYEGLIATPDHLVWVVGATQPIQLGEAAATRAHLVQTGADRREIRLGGDYTPNTSMVGQKMEQVLCIGKVHRLQKNTVDTTRKLNKRGFKRLPNLFKTKTSSQMVRETLRHGKTTMRKPKKPFIPLLWSTRDKIQIPFGASSRTLHFGKARLARQKFANGPHRQQWALPTGEFALCNTERKQLKQVRNCSNKILAKVLALLLWGSNQKVVSWNDSKRDNSGRKISGTHEKKELATYKRTARLYDIRNAGVNNRFTVSNRLVHNCGYGGSHSRRGVKTAC